MYFNVDMMQLKVKTAISQPYHNRKFSDKITQA